MKKFLLCFIVAVTAMVIMTVGVLADTATVNGITWTYFVKDGEAHLGYEHKPKGYGGGAAVSGCLDGSVAFDGSICYHNAVDNNEIAGAITIPSSLDGYPVTSIGDYAFYGCKSLTSVTIGNSVTSIGDYAFKYCSGLRSITIPNSVTSIGDEAFWLCTSLTNVTIPNSVTSIGDEAFYECRYLTSVVIGNSVTNIGDYAFYSCPELTSVEMGNSVISIGDSAFRLCTSLTSITIPDSVTSIGDYAFYNCRGLGLTSVTIPNSVTSIGAHAFDGCSFTSITIGNSVTSIGDSAFQWCSGLTSITIPNSVTSIGDGAFQGCIYLESATFLGNAPRYVGYDIFNLCGDDFTIKVKKGTKGWNGDYTSTALPATWHGYPIEYATESDSSSTNDNFVNAYTLTGASGSVNGSSDDATLESGEPAPSCQDNYGASVWWKWTAPATGTVVFDTIDSDFDTILAVYTGSSLSSLSEVSSNDDGGANNTSRCEFDVVSGTIYYIAVYGYSDNQGDIYLNWELSTSVEDKTALPNLAFAVFNSWEHEYGIFTSTNYPSCLRLFETGNEFLLIYGVGNFGEGNIDQTVGFKVQIESATENDIIFETEYKNDVELNSMQGYVDSQEFSDFDAGVYVARVTFDVYEELEEEDEEDNIGEIPFAIRDSLPLSNGLRCNSLVFNTSGDDWYGTSGDGPDGGDVARTAHLGNNRTNVLSTVVSGAGTISFDWKVSSEADYDILSVVVDGETIESVSGMTKGWQTVLIELGEGEHAIEWHYGKDDSYFDGFDCAWLSNVQWKPYCGGEYTPTSNFRYEVRDGGVIIDEYTGEDAVVNIPPSIEGYPVTSIGDWAFFGCSGLTSITIPDSVTSIGDWAFDGCSGLTSVTIPDSVTSIGDRAFYECVGLTNITIGNSVTSIGDCAFKECIKLKSVFIPASVSHISMLSFFQCVNLKELNVSHDNKNYKSVNGFLLSKDGKELIQATCEASAIPEGVIVIRNYSFSPSPSNLIIPASVVNIEPEAFVSSDIYHFNVSHDNKNYKSVNGFLLSKDGKTLIAGINGNVIIPDSVTSIGDCAFFEYCGLTSVTIPDSVTSIGKWAFYSCYYLKSAIFLGDAPRNAGNAIFDYCADDFTIKVKKGTKGWNGDYISTELPETWYGYPIEYATEDDLYPVLDANATAEDVANALSGSVDENLAKNITSVEMYSKYKAWASVVKAPTGDDAAGVEAVMASTTAWMSFALDQSKLIANEPVEGDVAIASLDAVAADGSFEFTVNIDNIDVGDGAVEENLKKLFKIEGATTLGNDANFSSENVEIELAEPVNGDVKFKILPKDSPDSFFIRATLLK